MKSFVIFCILILLSVSCGTVTNRSIPSGSLALGVPNNLKADIQVDMTKKLSGVASATRVLGIRINGSNNYMDGVTYGTGNEGGFSLFDTSDEVKSAAAYNAINGSNADVIIAPQYIIQKSGFLFFFSKTVVKVTGYPGVIKKIE